MRIFHELREGAGRLHSSLLSLPFFTPRYPSLLSTFYSSSSLLSLLLTSFYFLPSQTSLLFLLLTFSLFLSLSVSLSFVYSLNSSLISRLPRLSTPDPRPSTRDSTLDLLSVLLSTLSALSTFYIPFTLSSFSPPSTLYAIHSPYSLFSVFSLYFYQLYKRV